MNTYALARTTAALVVIVIIVVAGVSFYFITKPTSLSVSVATSTSVGTAGTPMTFTAIASPSSASISSVVWNFGDGTNETDNGAATTHTYTNGGRYLVLAQVTASVQSFLFSSSTVGSNSLVLFPLTVQPSLSPDQAPEASVPAISFPLINNPTAPIFSVGDVVHPVGGFLELPVNSNWTIQEYSWDFGNGNKQTVTASNETGDPTQNVTASYSNPGLYPLALTLVTGSNGATFEVTTVRTIAVQSSVSPFALLTTSSGAPNPGVITTAEVATGGAFSWDPQTDYDILGFEQISNIFQTVVQYNGSSIVSFIPYLAAALPTRDNGGISSDYKTYTFQIRNNQYFSNGDPATAYDVWFSFVRGIAFAAGTPGTPDWVQDQFLIPGVQNGTASVYTNNTWTAATSAVTYDNGTNTVTFHFNRPMSPTLAFQILAEDEGSGVVDARYAWSVGAGFNEANWDSYENQGNSASFNTQMQWSPVGSGPFMIKSYVPGQSVELVPNPYYGGVPGIPKQNTTVITYWVKSPDTALLMLQSGQADAVNWLPTSDYPAMEQMQSQGLLNIYHFPTCTEYYYSYNIEIDKDLEAEYFGSGFNEPSNYFADLPTRLAWIDAFDYVGYLNNIVGNAKYGTTFGSPYDGAIPPTMNYAVPPDQLGGLPAQNLNAARGNYSISAWHDMKITIPIDVKTGDLVNLAGADEYAAILAEISNGNITATPVQVTDTQLSAFGAPNIDPLSAWSTFWACDYPDPWDLVYLLYAEGGYQASAENFFASNFASLPPSTPYDVVHVNGTAYTQETVWNWLQGNVTLGGSSVDPAVKQRAFAIATKLAVAMGLYAYLYQGQQYWYFRSWLKGYAMEENPMFGGVSGVMLFYWLSKD